ncbi:MAG: hypothetical protein J0H73_11760 [Salana multivorans]|uniref:hypothetical protein n=1 Tax=Salana multivorans TaxID=120377 RepID=UPI0009633E29|nr:hypothetical protein [Salana multivorans]MBN8882975.1 hypothetical protein [Salana multivorans]OJX94071.1 MAG: hypothetical protein BGO96_09700 [Micrococcales bacterium 73-15]
MTAVTRKRVRVRRLRPGLWTVTYWQESPGRRDLVVRRYSTFDYAILVAAHVAGYFRPPPAA